MSLEKNKQIVAEFLSDTGNNWSRLAHPDMTLFVAGDMEGCGMLDMQGLFDLYGMLSEDAAAPLVVTPTRMIAEGDSVAVEAYGHMPLKNGRVYNNHYHMVFELRDGKIQHIREYSDTDHLRRIFELKGSAKGPKPDVYG